MEPCDRKRKLIHSQRKAARAHGHGEPIGGEVSDDLSERLALVPAGPPKDFKGVCHGRVLRSLHAFAKRPPRPVPGPPGVQSQSHKRAKDDQCKAVQSSSGDTHRNLLMVEACPRHAPPCGSWGRKCFGIICAALWSFRSSVSE